MNRTRNTVLYLLVIFVSFGCTRDLPDLEKGEIFRLYIEYEDSISYDQKIDIFLTELFEDYEKTLDGKIEKRGGLSSGFPKYSYEINLDRNYPLAGLPSDDDWVLNSNYIDKSFLRHVISFQLFREMDPRNIAPLCEYVEVSLNSHYNGLYVLMQKIDRSSLHVNKFDSESVIFKEPHLFRKTYEGIVPQDSNNFHQQLFPDIQTEDRSEELEEIRDFIINSDDNFFSENIGNIFDLENLIDWHLLILISNNSDGILKNYYLFRQNDRETFRVAPWDYDHSFGRDGDNELNLSNELPDLTRSILFGRLLGQDWYKKDLVDRWKNLNDNAILSHESLRERITDQSSVIRVFAEKNFTKWPIDSEWYFDDNDFEEEIGIMLQYLSQRHPELEWYFENL